MKKIININFHSRVIPIEESAYDILRQYIESLKRHFASEEGGDEIVNDIENRFAELFSDRLKKGASCITDSDVNDIITSMGRPEDFDQDESANTGSKGKNFSYSESTEEKTSQSSRLFRSENDKMLGGVCGGIAAYLKIDPSVVRIIYGILTVISFGTALFVYVLLWIFLPPKSLVYSTKKRLYRDPDHRVIGGVAGGLAAYFNMEIWIWRLIFSLPFIAGFLGSFFRHNWFDFDGPVIYTSGFGGTLFIIYIILWIVLPEANTASEKLEMRGEKIDIESIKNTIKSDLSGFKQKAAVVGEEIKERASQFGNDFKNRSETFRREVSSGNVPRQGIGHAIGVLFKAFFLFISVIFTFALITALVAILFTGAGFLPLKNYIFSGLWQNVLAILVVLFFLILPVIGLLIWIVRRIFGVRSRNNYLGYTFGSLWVVGLISLIILLASVSRRFSTRSGIKEDVEVSSPTNGKMIVKVDDAKSDFDDSDWMGSNWHHKGPFFNISEDSLTLNTVRVNIVRSSDTSWHLHREKISHGYNTGEAKTIASEISFPIEQKDSLLILSRGFSIKPAQQFRNQQVVVILEVPVGKKIFMSESLDNYHWFRITRIEHSGERWNITGDDESDWDSDVEYLMTDHGLERISEQEKVKQDDGDDNQEDQENKSSDSSKKNIRKDEYRYHKKVKTTDNAPSTKIVNLETEGSSPLILMTRLS
jgi:phage shock protein PspC (stress-responsive transcriptional regulator)